MHTKSKVEMVSISHKKLINHDGEEILILLIDSSGSMGSIDEEIENDFDESKSRINIIKKKYC